MKPSASKRDTLITFLSRTASQNDDYGTQEYIWAEHAKEYAEVQDILPSRSEKIDDSISIQRRPCRVRTLYRDDITSDMRIEFEGRTMEIVAGPAELGRRDGSEFICEQLSTQGDAP